MRKFVALLVVMLLAALAVVPAMAQFEEEEIPEDAGFIRVAHLAADVEGAIIFVDGEIVFSGLRFGNVTRWLPLAPGTYSVAVGTSADIEEAALGPIDLTVETNDFLTIGAIGTIANESLDVQVVAEDYSPITTGNARVTVWHAIEGAQPVDVLVNGSPVVEVLAYPGTIGSNEGVFTAELPAGTATLTVRSNLDPNVVLFDDEVTLPEGSNTIAYAVGTPDEPQVLFETVSEADFSEGRTYGEGEARVRVAHFSPDAPGVTIFVNGEIVFTGIRFGSVTRYLPVAPGTYEIIVSTDADPANAVIGPVDLTFGDGTFTTVGAIGSVEENTFQPIVITEADPAAEAGTCAQVEGACVVVLHAIEDAPVVDIVTGENNDVVLLAAAAYPGTFPLPSGGFNDGFEILDVPAGTYDLKVVPNAATAPVVLSAEGVEVMDGMYYLVAAIGLLEDGSAQLKLEVVDPANPDPADPF